MNSQTSKLESQGCILWIRGLEIHRGFTTGLKTRFVCQTCIPETLTYTHDGVWEFVGGGGSFEPSRMTTWRSSGLSLTCAGGQKAPKYLLRIPYSRIEYIGK